jgi:hypothetical protein
LNGYVKVSHNSNKTKSLLGTLDQYTLVIVTEPLGRELEESINNECRTKKIKNIISYCRGLVSRTFVDLGDEFIVVDKDGEEL